MMGWRQMAERRLMDYETMKKAKDTLPEELSRRKLPKEEEARMEMMAQKLFLKERLRQVSRWLDVTRKGLGALDPQERLVVQLLYIMPEKGNVGRLCEILNCGQTTVYRRRDRALKKFTKALYGRG